MSFSNAGAERAVELKAVDHFPDGTTVLGLVGAHEEVALPPGNSVLELPPIALPDGLAAGTYFVEVALLDRAHGATLSRRTAGVPVTP
jgi:hypothetical protein